MKKVSHLTDARIYMMSTELFVQFLKELVAIVTRYGAGAIGIKAAYDLLKSKIDVLVAVFETIYKSDYTVQLKDQDRYRDLFVRGLILIFRSYLHHPDADKRVAARKLLIILEHYKRLDRKSYDRESSAMDDMLDKLSAPDNAAHLTLLGLTFLVTELRAANATFFQLMQDRDSEVEQRPGITVKEARPAVESALSEMLARVEAIIMLNGIDFSTELTGFVADYNVMVDRYNHNLAIEKGRRKASSSADEENENDENEDDNASEEQ